MKIVIGIGNPGTKYRNTRHNAGFLALDRLAEKLKISFLKTGYNSLISETRLNDDGVLLMKPVTYVNRCGIAVAEAAGFYNVPPENIMAVCDDMDLPLGRLRIKNSGSSGGHNGLNSIIEKLGTNAFPRLRIGIARPAPEMDPADYVLSKFAAGEAGAVDEAIDRAADAVMMWLSTGIEACMNKYNV